MGEMADTGLPLMANVGAAELEGCREVPSAPLDGGGVALWVEEAPEEESVSSWAARTRESEGAESVGCMRKMNKRS